MIGGAMAYAFLKAKGVAIGRSRVEEDKVELARELLALADSKNLKILLPTDHIVAAEAEANATTYAVSEIPSAMMGLDIGPDTVAAFVAEIARAKTVVWNGPLGLFEIAPFGEGTMKIGEALANQDGVKSIIGGGDTASAIAHAPWANKLTHISTGGGATLEYLEGIELPGVKALDA